MPGLGFSLFARRYWGSRCFLSFPGGTEMFHFPPLPLIPYIFRHQYLGINPDGLPHSEISGSKLVWQLPEAYRNLLRPSSALGTKTFTMNP